MRVPELTVEFFCESFIFVNMRGDEMGVIMVEEFSFEEARFDEKGTDPKWRDFRL